ncbi:trypsin-like peptidase domain-containing protein [Oscillospiraceae bacterium WX1]
MKKRAVSIFLSLLLAFSVLPITTLAAGTLSNFTKVNTYQSGQFSDVSNQWFAPYVQTAYEYNLVNGTSATTFSPSKNLSIAEAIKLAACLHSIYNTGSASFPSGSPWYQPYVDYALSNGIISAPYANYTANATRADFAVILAGALPDEALTAKNQIDDNAIPDVAVSYSYAPAVYKLYRAGVLTGSDSAGTFYPGSSITRDAVASIVARMASTALRQPLTLTKKVFTTTEIATQCSPAVFYIELFSKTGKSIGSGSGFFISSSGLAVTCFHVIDGVTSAKIKTKDGKSYNVTGVYDYNETTDLALIQVGGSGFPYLKLGDSDSAVTGASIYAIGYPLGVDQTVTPGTITNASHPIDGVNYMMTNASISPGSSGGALIDAFGKVIGVTCAFYYGGQNLNLAVPINLLGSLSSTKTPVALSTLFPANTVYYASYPAIPDFGAYTGIPLYDQDYSAQYGAQYYAYLSASYSGDIEDPLDNYVDLLYLEGFDYDGYVTYNGYNFYSFIDATGAWSVTFGLLDVSGTEMVLLIISPT